MSDNNKSKSAIQCLIKKCEDIVISGISGRFPESDNIDEFAANLYNNVDMITDDDRRWPNDLHGINSRMGKLKEIDKFDGHFFGLLSNAAHSVDPESRILLETTYEAICDAGINPQILRGSKTGVYIGHTSFCKTDGIPQEIQEDLKMSMVDDLLYLTGSTKSMIASRVSYLFDFHGPSMVIDTACSSSLAAFDAAMTDIRLGKCDQAIVGTSQINLQSYIVHTYQLLGICSPKGISHVWDTAADGMVRSEAVACVLLQRKSHAKRIYATVLHSRVNSDGYKKEGIFAPSTYYQRELMEQTYKEAEVNPNDVKYIEAHATGTKIGDTIEAKAIAEAYCKDRKEPLSVGLLKSNIGHTEGAAGLSAITKVAIIFENKCIPANLNYNHIKAEIGELVPPLVPINHNTPFDLGLCAVNASGIGGTNCHVILKPNYKELTAESYKIAQKIPRLININGRTDDALNHVFDFIEKNPTKVTREFLALLDNSIKGNCGPKTSEINSVGFPYRGSMIIKEITESDEISKKYTYLREKSVLNGNEFRPIWFFFSGMGSQWIGMGRALMSIDIFAKTINECAEIIKPYDIDLYHLLLSDDIHTQDDITHSFVSITSIQCGLCDLINALNIKPDGIIGHSFGEIGCAYGDGCITLKEALMATYSRGKVFNDGLKNGKIKPSMMIAVGMSWDEAKKRCPNGVYPACDNAPDNVTISGPYEETKKFMEQLKSENIFVREVACHNVPFHSPYVYSLRNNHVSEMKKHILAPRARTNRWKSTAIPESKWTEDEAKYASPEYFADNTVNPVHFNQIFCKHVPQNAIVIEIAPHALFANIIKRIMPSVKLIGLLKRNISVEENMEYFLSSIGKIHQCGINVDISNLYPKVEWPVPRTTQSISSLIKWDHRESYLVKKYPEYYFHATAADMRFNYSLSNAEYKFFTDHCIDGKIIFPAMGYLMLVWRKLASTRGQRWENVPVVFENVQFVRSVMFTGDSVKLACRFLDPTGEFVILENDNVVTFGRAYVPNEMEERLKMQHILENDTIDKTVDDNIIELNSTDIYKEFRVRGYDYGPEFRGILNCKLYSDKVIGQVKWTNNWIAFMDSILQLIICSAPIKSLFIPMNITSLRCDPKILFDAIDKAKESNKSIVNDEFNNNLIDVNTDNESVINNNTQNGQTILPAVYHSNLKSIVSYGIEIRDVNAVSILRKPQTKGLTLEKYQFIPNNEIHAIEGSYKTQIKEYINVCTSLARKYAFGINVNNIGIVNDDAVYNESLINKWTKNITDDQILLKILNEMSSKTEDNIRICDESLINITNKLNDIISIPENDQSRDILNQFTKNERLFRPLIDIVNENCSFGTNRSIKILEITFDNNIVANHVIDMLNSTFITLPTIDYTVAYSTLLENSNNINGVKNEYKSIKLNMDEINLQNNSFDFIILKNVIENFDVNLKSYLSVAFNALKGNGFLLSVFRSQFTHPEMALHYLKNQKLYSMSNYINRVKDLKRFTHELGLKVNN